MKLPDNPDMQLDALTPQEVAARDRSLLSRAGVFAIAIIVIYELAEGPRRPSTA